MDSLPHSLLVDVWFCILALMAACYVVSDGFDLGIGILSLLAPDRAAREVMIDTILHVRDANETWLVVLGGGLFGAFPAAYAMLLPQLYVPVITMILGLIVRGAAVELRGTAPELGPQLPGLPDTQRRARWGRTTWDGLLGAGSLVAAVSQGAILGRILTGMRPGTWHGLLVVAAMVGVTAGYALLGSTYLIGRAIGHDMASKGLASVDRRARRWTLCALLLAVSGALLLAGDLLWHRRETVQALPLLPLALGAVALALALYLAQVVASLRGVAQTGHAGARRTPFVMAVLLFLVSLAALASSVFPYIVPGHLTLAEAASEDRVLALMLAGVAVLLPIMIGYTLYRNLRSMARPSAGRVT
ncbi:MULTISPECIES: cytochrome d ubiquinol oxidase subunit II [unclassified Cupriavidus]|uniref:cytochrome d ubiquinol oxidase subunit II n=1 Tax=unclassified Cupriavidus TaxID=2640874 RepID=UPI00313C2F5E